MKKQFHILNGDALREQFPQDIGGDQIVVRECLMDGSLEGNSLAEFFESRANYICEIYPNTDKMDYFQITVSELVKLQNIPPHSEINFWFEDDLFCQVNFWFVLNLIKLSNENARLFLVRPPCSSPYSFGVLNDIQLISAYDKRVELSELDKWSNLWRFYKSGDTEMLLKSAEDIEDKYPFVIAAVRAHIDRFPTEESLGKPSDTLVAIMKDLDTNDFKKVLHEFRERVGIYGFSNLQIKKLYDGIIVNS